MGPGPRVGLGPQWTLAIDGSVGLQELAVRELFTSAREGGGSR
jgi:hypothetical protein